MFRNKNKQKGSHLKKRCSFNLYLDSNENRNDEVLSESTNDDYKSFDVDSKNSDNGVKRIMTDDINSNDNRDTIRLKAVHMKMDTAREVLFSFSRELSSNKYHIFVSEFSFYFLMLTIIILKGSISRLSSVKDLLGMKRICEIHFDWCRMPRYSY